MSRARIPQPVRSRTESMGHASTTTARTWTPAWRLRACAREVEANRPGMPGAERTLAGATPAMNPPHEPRADLVAELALARMRQTERRAADLAAALDLPPEAKYTVLAAMDRTRPTPRPISEENPAIRSIVHDD